MARRGRLLPAEPLCAFVERLILRERAAYVCDPFPRKGVVKTLTPERRVEALLRISPRDLYALRHRRRRWVSESFADACLCAEGSMSLGDLWPEVYWAEDTQLELAA